MVIPLCVYPHFLWITLLAIAGNGNYGDIGVIAHTYNLGISVTELARMLGISVRQWYRYRDKYVNEFREGGGIAIKHNPDDVDNTIRQLKELGY